MDTREFQALELAARAAIKRNGAGWLVPSLTHNGSYRVNQDATDCSCEDFELHGKPCKHMLAVRIVRERDFTPAPVRTPIEVPKDRPRKPTCKQQWDAYNAAQCGEKRAFLPLLADLCRTVPEPPRKPGPGRKPIPVADGLFAAILKVYSGFSARRFTTDLQDAMAAGVVGTAPHFNVVLRVLDDEAMTPILKGLVTRSALPLRAVETNYAIDSSGFSTSRFERWFDAKYGVERRRSTWVKTHICVGVRTNVVTAVEIGPEHDGQHFPALLRTTAENFTLGDVTADKAYLSLANVQLVGEMGGTPFIPPKVRSVADREGEHWRRMFHLFALNREEFCKRYHQRSNVESTFSMVKRKFGDSVRAKTPVAMANEVLAKLVCHNVVCCIHEMHELGIDPGFGGGKGPVAGVGEPRIVPFPGVG